MPIRQRLRKKYQIIPYHREYGSLANPPIKHGFWPNGAFVVSNAVPGRKGKTIVLGWIVKRDLRGGFRTYGAWIATNIGWVERPIPVKYHNLDVAKDHKYLDEFEDFNEALEMLKEAWVEEHGIVLR